MEQFDEVQKPKHYNVHPSGVECIEIVEHLPSNLANAMKYVWRNDHKGKAAQDLKKAIWYLEREKNRIKGHLINNADCMTVISSRVFTRFLTVLGCENVQRSFILNNIFYAASPRRWNSTAQTLDLFKTDNEDTTPQQRIINAVRGIEALIEEIDQ